MFRRKRPVERAEGREELGNVNRSRRRAGKIAGPRPQRRHVDYEKKTRTDAVITHRLERAGDYTSERSKLVLAAENYSDEERLHRLAFSSIMRRPSIARLPKLMFPGVEIITRTRRTLSAESCAYTREEKEEREREGGSYGFARR